MAVSLPFVRRRPPPRHAAPDPPRPTGHRRGDGTTIGLIVVLVLTSGFVAGTTATFSGTTSNAANEFASAALSPPTGLSATPSGTNVNVAWTDASGYDNVNAGYRVSAADWQAAPQPVPTVCATGSAYTKIATSSSSSYSDTTTATNPPHPNTLVDGRLWCYKAETVYPFPENTSPWLSQTGNPTTVVEMGHTLTGAAMIGDGDTNFEPGTAVADGPDYFEFTFNQSIPVAQYPTGFICVDGSAERILIGMSNSTDTSCPKTGANADTALRGFAITGGTITPNSIERFTIGTVSSVGCAGGAPPGCFRMRINVKTRTAGSTTNPVLSGTWVVRGTNNTSFLTSTGGRSFCQAGGTTTISGVIIVRADPTTPAAGKCQITGLTNSF